MNEHEMLASLMKLKEQITTEMEHAHEKLWDKERSIHGLIDSLMYRIDDQIHARIAAAEKDAQIRGIIQAAEGN